MDKERHKGMEETFPFALVILASFLYETAKILQEKLQKIVT